MDITALLAQAANLMLTGMVGVFVFLSILIIAVKGLSKFAAPDEPVQPRSQAAKSKPAGAEQVPAEHLAAISAAISQYRNQHFPSEK
ncbi:oxaloacetate decarboxylase [Pseudoalteromonas rubra]|uniref:Probable oxaloacetate decarboxylase gamma chain n=1 Tax=Pseudoalteromonas rubra TaxID=43658 RepID=A0A4Q7EDB1_9GAMM|nr:OadG family transporter subunit [Pseudoalteromonas rubra]RZM81129.1 oxaloacetate decarboxylase [Pseudoalteromonas rubra]